MRKLKRESNGQKIPAKGELAGFFDSELLSLACELVAAGLSRLTCHKALFQKRCQQKASSVDALALEYGPQRVGCQGAGSFTGAIDILPVDPLRREEAAGIGFLDTKERVTCSINAYFVFQDT